jgi:PLP dependent protein
MATSSIEQNLIRIRERILAACARAGRAPNSVRLVAVSKLQSEDKIRESLQAGQSVFGENYVQEAVKKINDVAGAEWHLIGALQSNKAKDVVGKFSLIHSIDRESILEAVSKRAVEAGVVQPVLLEVNVAGEQTKAGIPEAQIADLVLRARDLPGILVLGLMCMPPFSKNPEDSRPYFKKMKKLLAQFASKEFCELSMGTSQDFEVAIEEGATLVRVGSEIFGARETK